MSAHKVRLASGQQEIRGVNYRFELWSNNVNFFIKTFTLDGQEIEFIRNQKTFLKKDIESALIMHAIIPE